MLGLDVKDKICEICPTMVNSTVTKDVSDHTIKSLSSEVEGLREVKIQRMQKVSVIALILHPVKIVLLEATLMFCDLSATKSCHCTIRDVEFDGYTT